MTGADEEAWQSELSILFGDVSDEEQGAGEMAASSTMKRNECTPTKDGRLTKKSKEDHPSDDVEHVERPSISDVLASLSIMRNESKEFQKNMKKDMKKMCSLMHEDVKKV